MRGHEIETGWADSGEMRAYCRRCKTWFCAYCSDATCFLAVKEAEREARRPFEDYDCFDA